MVAFRDASFEPDGFQLQASDVVKGVERAVRCGVLQWADFDLAWFEYCDHPGTADLHAIVPGKFVAFKGPKKTGAFHRQTGVRDVLLLNAHALLVRMVSLSLLSPGSRVSRLFCLVPIHTMMVMVLLMLGVGDEVSP